MKRFTYQKGGPVPMVQMLTAHCLDVATLQIENVIGVTLGTDQPWLIATSTDGRDSLPATITVKRI